MLFLEQKKNGVFFFLETAQTWYFGHDDIMDIDVVLFTLLAPVWHIQGLSLHVYIMGNATVPW
jgi:hypothetical protein